MKIAADTNVLVRVITEDDEAQAGIARNVLSRAELVAVALPALCELSWVLSRLYRYSPSEIAMVIRTLVKPSNIAVNRPAVDAGLSFVDAGGDFADGVIVHEGRWLGGEMFVSFDKAAVRFAMARGGEARLL